ncbi:hypothetical protein PG2001B_1591 [Bifidobacterium pseudolongum subsp. globosum]|uniref:Uncharacterized protein n=1 Tax=Bifidobacterium pseudolongum subsp. globosum TaxID=1690 RepID=A0A4Q5AWH5_9BIFI|nr:hypothetical protein PG2001B_1591 [Bifidobacterium pseudolongum subsp. globosum]
MRRRDVARLPGKRPSALEAPLLPDTCPPWPSAPCRTPASLAWWPLHMPAIPPCWPPPLLLDHHPHPAAPTNRCFRRFGPCVRCFGHKLGRFMTKTAKTPTKTANTATERLVCSGYGCDDGCRYSSAGAVAPAGCIWIVEALSRERPRCANRRCLPHAPRPRRPVQGFRRHPACRSGSRRRAAAWRSSR